MRSSPEIIIPAEIGFSPEVLKFGAETAIAWGSWGENVDNLRLMKIIGQEAWERNKDMVLGTGIWCRQHILRPDLRNREFSEIAEEQIEIGAAITQMALRANGWDKADLIIVATSTPPYDNFAERIAERAGLADAKTKLYCLACNGAIAAFHDVLRTDGLKRVVITAVEGLSYGVDLREGKVDIAGAAIFGNGASSLAFSPKNFELLAGKTKILHDKVGVIRAPEKRIYELPPKEERLAYPDWYDVDLEAREIFAITQNRVMQKLPKREEKSDYLEMLGMLTARFFTKHVPPEAKAVLEEYYQQHDQPISIGISHQPSRIVLKLVERRLGRMLKKENHSPIEFPWVLDRVGMGNVSSATTFIALAQLMRENRVPRDEPFLLLGFGVGPSATALVLGMNLA